MDSMTEQEVRERDALMVSGLWNARIYFAGALRSDGEGYEPARVAHEWKTYATLGDAHDAARAVSHEHAGIATFAGYASPYQSGSLFCMCSTCDELRRNRRNALQSHRVAPDR